MLFLSHVCELPAAYVVTTCVAGRSSSPVSVPALGISTRTSEARAVLLVVLVMCILSHPGKA